MDAAEIFLRGRWKVGGRWVGPITLGHAMLLEAFQLLDVSTPRSYALALLKPRPNCSGAGAVRCVARRRAQFQGGVV